MTITHLDSMQSFAIDFVHLRRDRVLAVSCETIHTGSQQKLRAGVLRGTKEFVDIAFPIADVYASSRITQRAVDCYRLSSQRMLSFFSIGTRVGLILLLSASDTLNFLRDQNLIAVRPRGSPSVVTAKLECIRIPQPV